MSTYSKAQEKRMRDQFEKFGFEVIENTARDTQHRGDAIINHQYTGREFCIDHKSTVNKEGIRIERKQLEKIASEAKGHEIPLLTISFKNCRKLYVVMSIEDLDEVLR